MERKVLDIKLLDKVRNEDLRRESSFQGEKTPMALERTSSQDDTGEMGTCNNDMGPETRKKKERTSKTQMVTRIQERSGDRVDKVG
jgi:hypothetical protein